MARAGTNDGAAVAFDPARDRLASGVRAHEWADPKPPGAGDVALHAIGDGSIVEPAGEQRGLHGAEVHRRDPDPIAAELDTERVVERGHAGFRR